MVTSRRLRILTIGFCLLIALVLYGCRGNGRAEPQEPPVTVAASSSEQAPVVEMVPTYTSTPEQPPTPALPTVTQELQATPTPTPHKLAVRVRVEANVRSGPGTNYTIIDTLQVGATVHPVARTRDQTWLELEEGWLFADLVDGSLDSLPIAGAIPATPIPLATSTFTQVPHTPAPISTPRPTFTPIPKLGDIGKPILVGSNFNTPEGLRIKVISVKSHDHPDIDKFLTVPVGSHCRGCLVIEIEIFNAEGNEREYVMLDDLALWTTQAVPTRKLTANPVICDAVPASSFYPSPAKGRTRRLKAIEHRREAVTRYLCYKGIEDDIETVRRYYLLAYSHQYFYQPTEPTPTPRSDGIQTVRDPLETEQNKRRGWTIFFNLNSGG